MVEARAIDCKDKISIAWRRDFVDGKCGLLAKSEHKKAARERTSKQAATERTRALLKESAKGWTRAPLKEAARVRACHRLRESAGALSDEATNEDNGEEHVSRHAVERTGKRRNVGGRDVGMKERTWKGDGERRGKGGKEGKRKGAEGNEERKEVGIFGGGAREEK